MWAFAGEYEGPCAIGLLRIDEHARNVSELQSGLARSSTDFDRLMCGKCVQSIKA